MKSPALVLAIVLLCVFLTCAASDSDPAMQARFADLLKRLDQDDWQVRDQATKEVVALPSSYLPMIEAALRDRNLSPEVETKLSSLIGYLRRRAKSADREARREGMLASYRDFVLAEYARVGSHNPKWDRAADDGLVMQVALASSHGIGRQGVMRTIQALQRSVDAGCDDPLVRLFLALDRQTAAGKQQDLYDEINNSTTALLKRDYTARFKIVALTNRARAWSLHINILDDGKERERYLSDLQAAVNLLPKIRTDHQPAEDATLSLANSIFDLYQVAQAATEESARNIADALSLAEPGSIEPSLFRVTCDLRLAHGWNQSPRNQEQHRSAYQLASAAVKADPKSIQAAQLKMACVNPLRDPTEFRSCYDAVLAINPDDFQARELMLNYLIVTGDDSAVLEFADECLQTRAWIDRTPLLAVTAVQGLAKKMSVEEAATYLGSPPTWARIQQAYDGEFLVIPHDSSLRSHYAWYACETGHWAIADEQFKSIGEDIDSQPFGTEDSAEYYRKKASRLAKESIPLTK